MKSSADISRFFLSSSDQPPGPLIQKRSIHDIGYQIIRRAIEIDEKVLKKAQNFASRNGKTIFNHNEENKNDRKRRQCNLPLNTEFMRQFDQSVKNIVKEKVNTDLLPTDPVILHSRPGCQAQAAHCDYVPDETLANVSDEQMPLAALIALMPETCLKVWPESLHLAAMGPEDLKTKKPIACEQVKLSPGDMIIFRGDFVHAGSDYETDNYRIHYYLDSPVVPRIGNRTWIINESGNKELCRLIQPETKQPEQKAISSRGRKIKKPVLFGDDPQGLAPSRKRKEPENDEIISEAQETNKKRRN